MSRSRMRRARIDVARQWRDERGSTIPLIIGFFIVAGLMLIAGVVASAAFLAQRELQAGCDGAAIAAADGIERSAAPTGGSLPFDEQAARAAAADYIVATWGSEAAAVSVQVSFVPGRVVVTCAKVAQVPFDEVFSPGGIPQTVEAAADAPLIG
ncbi:hypothetical protein EK0264_04350 [Epidermidibacterium keratini]|uniref:Putative Flp pilus-assembly TadG-like N-terminal domain-containing protein n=1 Tax=Epidermidibacterium keratini TaxID=1891644 RepID=A0A7L4YJZ9_9ACTN|nr:pilus assembly protein TadG-related protein [Epidermidibacterium keratini]QHB99590.1 hypothetical protein EK0264_04350 [Epidermidibacterium keratini]